MDFSEYLKSTHAGNGLRDRVGQAGDAIANELALPRMVGQALAKGLYLALKQGHELRQDHPELNKEFDPLDLMIEVTGSCMTGSVDSPQADHVEKMSNVLQRMVQLIYDEEGIIYTIRSVDGREIKPIENDEMPRLIRDITATFGGDDDLVH